MPLRAGRSEAAWRFADPEIGRLASAGEVVYGTSIPDRSRVAAGVLRAEEVAMRANFAVCALVGGVLKVERDELFRAAGPVRQG